MITSRLSSGLPRQLRLTKLNMRCSILFHLLVPGGKWQTRIFRPVAVGEALQLAAPEPGALGCWTPPESAVIVSVVAFG